LAVKEKNPTGLACNNIYNGMASRTISWLSNICWRIGVGKRHWGLL